MKRRMKRNMYPGRSYTYVQLRHWYQSSQSHPELKDVPREASGEALFSHDMPHFRYLWLAKIDKPHSSDLGETLLASPLAALPLDKLECTAGRGEHECWKLSGVDGARHGGLGTYQNLNPSFGNERTNGKKDSVQPRVKRESEAA